MRLRTCAPAFALLASTVVLAACGAAHPASPKTGVRVIHVVAGENFWGNIAAQIGGRHVAVTSIINDPTADPHLYESDPHDAGEIATANLVIVNGVGYDDFMGRLLAASSGKGRRVLTVSKVLHIAGSNPNPHLWYDIPRVPVVAAAITAALTRADPADKKLFNANLARFDRSLKPVLNTIATIRTRYPGAPVAYTERVPGYLLTAAGLTNKTPEGFAAAIEDGNEPSPADTQTMNTAITKHQIDALLYNAQATSPITKHAQQLARQAGIPIVPVTETLPPTEPNYQTWQLHQTQALRAALARQP